jgi:anti-sigma-K factor RskA
MTEQGSHDAAALYVLDALNQEEARGFEAHLGGCSECQGEVIEMRGTTERMSHAVDADPPPALRSTVLARIAATDQDDAHPTGSDASPDSSRAIGSAPEHLAEVRPLRTAHASRAALLVAAAAVLVAAGFGIWGLHTRHDAQQATARETQLLDLLGAGDVQTASGTVRGGGSGTVVLSHVRHRAVFVSSGLRPLPADEVYELWTVRSRAVPAGTFRPSGGAATVVSLPGAALSAGHIAMTVEPKGGSSQPTGAPVLAVDVPPTS